MSFDTNSEGSLEIGMTYILKEKVVLADHIFEGNKN